MSCAAGVVDKEGGCGVGDGEQGDRVGREAGEVFDEGYIVVQGVEAGKDGETRLLSNRSMDLVGLGENEATTFKVYPNPAKDRFIVEGSGTMTVMNTLGQTILTQEIDGKASVELPQGMYFVKLGGATRKVVVE